MSDREWKRATLTRKGLKGETQVDGWILHPRRVVGYYHLTEKEESPLANYPQTTLLHIGTGHAIWRNFSQKWSTGLEESIRQAGESIEDACDRFPDDMAIDEMRVTRRALHIVWPEEESDE